MIVYWTLAFFTAFCGLTQQASADGQRSGPCRRRLTGHLPEGSGLCETLGTPHVGHSTPAVLSVPRVQAPWPKRPGDTTPRAPLGRRGVRLHPHIGPAHVVVASRTRVPASGPITSRRASRKKSALSIIISLSVSDCETPTLTVGLIQKGRKAFFSRSKKVIRLPSRSRMPNSIVPQGLFVNGACG